MGNSALGERLQKVLARLGVASRRSAEELIRQGRVTVNGYPAQIGQRVNEGDRIEVDGAPVGGVIRAVTMMLNKPTGTLSTVSDDRGRPTVMDLVPDVPRLHPVGRLDLDSEGLLLLTTDGELTLRLTHPRYGHLKSYRAWCLQGSVPRRQLRRLLDGVVLEDGVATALDARPLPGGCALVLAEGRKRQVRRMLAAVGFEVARLQRTAIGKLELGELNPGEWRELSESDVTLALASGS